MLSNSRKKRPHDLFHTKKRHTSEIEATKPAQSSCQLPHSPSSPLKTRAHPHTTPPSTRRTNHIAPRVVHNKTRPRVSSHKRRKLNTAVSLRMHTFTTVRKGHMNKLLSVRWRVPHETKNAPPRRCSVDLQLTPEESTCATSKITLTACEDPTTRLSTDIVWYPAWSSRMPGSTDLEHLENERCRNRELADA